MNQNLETMIQNGPTLTLDPFAQEVPAAPAVQQIEETQPPVMSQEEQLRAILSPEELRQVDAFSAQIDVMMSFLSSIYLGSVSKPIFS